MNAIREDMRDTPVALEGDVVTDPGETL